LVALKNAPCARFLSTQLNRNLLNRLRETWGNLRPGTGLDTLYRARVFTSDRLLEEAMNYPERFIGPPPSGVGAAGRMNAKGVSVFYGSVESNAAIAEVRPPVGSSVVVAPFKVIRKLRVLDITRLGPVKVTGSKFDRSVGERYERSAFLDKLRSRLVLPVMPGSEDDGYLITQAVADYLSMDGALSLDGIMFPSVQNAGGEASSSNVILFHKASNVKAANFQAPKWSEFTLWEYAEEGEYYYCPQLFTRPLTEFQRTMRRPHSPEYSLELDRDNVHIHRIKGVEFRTDDTPVIHRKQDGANPPDF